MVGEKVWEHFNRPRETELEHYRETAELLHSTFKGNHGYFKDDTLRTLQLFAKASEENKAP